MQRTDGDGLAEKRRAELLNAAEALLATHGYEGLRLRDVSQASGLSVGLIQHYFGTRDELLLETMRVASERRVEQWSGLADDGKTPAARFWSLVEGSVGDAHRCIVWIETCAAATRHESLRPNVVRTQQAWLDTLTAVLIEGAEDGSLPRLPSATDTAELLVRIIDGFMLDAALDEARGSTTPVAGRRLDLLKEAAARVMGVVAPA